MQSPHETPAKVESITNLKKSNHMQTRELTSLETKTGVPVRVTTADGIYSVIVGGKTIAEVDGADKLRVIQMTHFLDLVAGEAS